MEETDFAKQNVRDLAARPLSDIATKLLKQGFNVSPGLRFSRGGTEWRRPPSAACACWAAGPCPAASGAEVFLHQYRALLFGDRREEGAFLESMVFVGPPHPINEPLLSKQML